MLPGQVRGTMSWKELGNILVAIGMTAVQTKHILESFPADQRLEVLHYSDLIKVLDNPVFQEALAYSFNERSYSDNRKVILTAAELVGEGAFKSIEDLASCCMAFELFAAGNSKKGISQSRKTVKHCLKTAGKVVAPTVLSDFLGSLDDEEAPDRLKLSDFLKLCSIGKDVVVYTSKDRIKHAHRRDGHGMRKDENGLYKLAPPEALEVMDEVVEKIMDHEKELEEEEKDVGEVQAIDPSLSAYETWWANYMRELKKDADPRLDRIQKMWANIRKEVPKRFRYVAPENMTKADIGEHLFKEIKETLKTSAAYVARTKDGYKRTTKEKLEWNANKELMRSKNPCPIPDTPPITPRHFVRAPSAQQSTKSENSADLEAIINEMNANNARVLKAIEAEINHVPESSCRDVMIEDPNINFEQKFDQAEIIEQQRSVFKPSSNVRPYLIRERVTKYPFPTEQVYFGDSNFSFDSAETPRFPKEEHKEIATMQPGVTYPARLGKSENEGWKKKKTAAQKALEKFRDQKSKEANSIIEEQSGRWDKDIGPCPDNIKDLVLDEEDEEEGIEWTKDDRDAEAALQRKKLDSWVLKPSIKKGHAYARPPSAKAKTPRPSTAKSARRTSTSTTTITSRPQSAAPSASASSARPQSAVRRPSSRPPSSGRMSISVSQTPPPAPTGSVSGNPMVRAELGSDCEMEEQSIGGGGLVRPRTPSEFGDGVGNGQQHFQGRRVSSLARPSSAMARVSISMSDAPSVSTVATDAESVRRPSTAKPDGRREPSPQVNYREMRDTGPAGGTLSVDEFEALKEKPSTAKIFYSRGYRPSSAASEVPKSKSRRASTPSPSPGVRPGTPLSLCSASSRPSSARPLSARSAEVAPNRSLAATSAMSQQLILAKLANVHDQQASRLWAQRRGSSASNSSRRGSKTSKDIEIATTATKPRFNVKLNIANQESMQFSPRSSFYDGMVR